MERDWNLIKTEYITTNTSYRKLGEKYGIHYTVIAARAKQDGWLEQREQFSNKTVTETLEAVTEANIDRATKLLGVSDMLLDKVRRLLEEDIGVDTQGMKHISGVLKDIKEIQMIRSDADMREQEARIANLQKQAHGNETEGTQSGVLLIPCITEIATPTEGNDE